MFFKVSFPGGGSGSWKLPIKNENLGSRILIFNPKIKTRGCACRRTEMEGSQFFVLGSYRGSKLAPLALSTRCGLSGSKLSRKKKESFFPK